jgi:hypothetical protein
MTPRYSPMILHDVMIMWHIDMSMIMHI